MTLESDNKQSRVEVKDVEDEKIEISFIEDKFEGGYWEACLRFINDNWHESIASMSEKQISWAHKILDDCVEKRIEG